MIFSRVIQFNRAILASIRGVTNKDLEFVRTYLNDKEFMIFNMMSSFDKLHCIRVAKTVQLCKYKEDINLKNKLVKIALIHDVGKSVTKYTIIHRVILVLIKKTYKNKKFNFSWRKADIYYNHAEIGYNILKQYGFDEDILFVVKNHHNKDENDKMVKLLMKCDEKN